MKIYFTASITGKKQYLSNYEKIVDFLKKGGNEVISGHIIASSESEVQMESKEERLQFHEKLEDWINSSECVIADVSFPSISVGYEISLALSRGKPVLMLYCDHKPPTLLKHHRDENLICEKYTPNTLPGILDDFLNYVEGKEDSRFTFYITSAIASFLEEVSQKEKMPKAVFVRKLIEKEMRNRK